MSRPIPHIGRTLGQVDKVAVRRRIEAQLRRLHAEEEAAAFQPLPAQFVAANDDTHAEDAPPRLPRASDVFRIFAADMARTAAALVGWALFGLLFTPAALPLVRAIRVWLG